MGDDHGRQNMIEQTPDAAQPNDTAIGEAITAMARQFDAELVALTEDQLAAKWYFSWDERGSIAWNIYEFSQLLAMHQRRCRRWEEHHNGSMCVVERVRDKYLMPRIKDFVIELNKRRADNPVKTSAENAVKL